MNQSPVTVYGFSFSHHGQYSSFHRLLHYTRDCRVVDVTIPLRFFLGPAWRGRLEHRWFRWNEWRLRPVFTRRERQCVHYIYPENSLFRGSAWKGRHGLLLTCHQPGNDLQRMVRGDWYRGLLRGLREADRVVVLAAHVADDYKEFCDLRRLAVIPHGVEVGFFEPAPDRPQRPLVLTVGNWLRDYDFWAEIVLRLADQIPDVEFAVVALPPVVHAARARVEPRLPGRVLFLHGLTDEQLKALYQRAVVLFLPLKDTVANNALLESMASGVPAVVSDLPAAREYAGECGTFFRAGATEDCLAKLAELLGDAEKRAALAAACRQRAVAHFSWEVIAARYARLYAEVLADRYTSDGSSAA
jgi:glycosyltransferase involved in cell wall biosynthesis